MQTVTTIGLDIAAIAEELNDEFKQRYVQDQDFRKRFDAYLRKDAADRCVPHVRFSRTE
jgi:hypothetical protein